MLRVAMVLVMAVGTLVSATPIGTEEAADLVSFVETVKEAVVADKAVQQELLHALQNIANTQVNIQRFLVGSNEIDVLGTDATITEEAPAGSREESLRFFTGHVVAALNSGNNTQLDAILTELKTLNEVFKGYFKKLDCPDPFTPVGDECFNFQLEDLSWEESRQRCRRLGAELAEPKDLTLVRLYIGEHFPRKSRRNFWIGGINNNKVWEWLSGTPIPAGYWYTNEPSGNGECLAMFDGWVHPLTDFPCENPRRAICERKTGVQQQPQ